MPYFYWIIWLRVCKVMFSLSKNILIFPVVTSMCFVMTMVIWCLPSIFTIDNLSKDAYRAVEYHWNQWGKSILAHSVAVCVYVFISQSSRSVSPDFRLIHSGTSFVTLSSLSGTFAQYLGFWRLIKYYALSPIYSDFVVIVALGYVKGPRKKGNRKEQEIHCRE